MSTGTLLDTVDPYLPTDGVMGALRTKRPALYWLTLFAGATAYAGVVLGVLYALLLFPLVAGRAIVAAATDTALVTGAWFVVMVAIAVFFVAVIAFAARWVRQFMEAPE